MGERMCEHSQRDQLNNENDPPEQRVLATVDLLKPSLVSSTRTTFNSERLSIY